MYNPLYQGRADGLCGLYSCVNSVRYLLQINDTQCQELFEIGMNYLNNRTSIVNTTLNGMRFPMIKGMINKFKPKIREWKWDLTTNTNLIDQNQNIKGIITSIKNWTNNKGTCAIIGIYGRIDHWTCVRNVTEKTIILYDSNKIKQIKIQHITSGKTKKEKPYGICEVLGVAAKKIYNIK